MGQKGSLTLVFSFFLLENFIDVWLWMANSSKIVSGLFGANAVWHGLSMYYFLLKSRSMLGRYSQVRPISDLSVDILNWLGALNSGYFLLSVLGFVRSYKHRELRTTDLWILALVMKVFF